MNMISRTFWYITAKNYFTNLYKQLGVAG